ncbi:MAG: hypothetical protein ABSH47_03940 [Bryobacteraceae bacterium]
MRLRSYIPIILFFAAAAGARAEVALFLEEPFAKFGRFNPTGHAAVYLSRVCAASPVSLRRCGPEEPGVVISRYYRVGGYDWVAIPLLPYLYAVDDPSEIPAEVDTKTEALLRDRYRRSHLLDIVPDDRDGTAPDGTWIQLIGSAYDRKIYVLELDTDDEQDERFIEKFNTEPNASHFNLLFSNCAGFSSRVINFFHPHATHRSFIADVGLSTPKQVAKSLIRYGRHHPDSRFRAFVVPQVPGSLGRSKAIRGILESLVTGPEYTLPAAAFVHPFVLCGAAAVYLTRPLFHSGRHFPGDIGVPLNPDEIASKLAFDNQLSRTDYRRQ